jgi:hypothetical protein
MFMMGRKKARVARYVCEQANGPPPSPIHEAAHNCGKGHEGCVNPSHLRWATPKENVADTLIHGTRNRGERQGISKLTREQVLRIRSLRYKMTPLEISKIMGVTDGNIRHILAGKTWSCIDDENDVEAA